MKGTRHNGRSGKNGVYNPLHNDRRFNPEHSEHIDNERVRRNIYWDCYQGYTTMEDQGKENNFSFEQIELAFYEEHYGNYVMKQNERHVKARHPDRCKEVEDVWKNKKTCPEESIYQLGTIDEHASVETLILVFDEFKKEFDKRFGSNVHIIDWSLHMDEATPHIHERHVFDATNRYGEIEPKQETALEELGFELPDPEKKRSKTNNRKVVFDSACRTMFLDICKRHGLELDEEPSYGGRKYLEKQDYIRMKQKEEIANQQETILMQIDKVNENRLELAKQSRYVRANEEIIQSQEEKIKQQDTEFANNSDRIFKQGDLIEEQREELKQLTVRIEDVETLLDEVSSASDFVYEVVKHFLMEALSRIYRPGCKADEMLCLVGQQGAGKSTFFRFLALNDDWFSDDLKQLNDSKIYEHLRGHWIMEMSEMIAAISAKSNEEIKSFLTRQKDTYRNPYDKYEEDRKRQCIFAGSTNTRQFIPFDRTGARRFLPIAIDSSKAEKHILDDEKEARAYFDQLWAEAMEIYWSTENKSSLLKFSKEMEQKISEYRKQFTQEDTMAGMIQGWLDAYKGTHVCSVQIWKEAFDHFEREPKKFETNEICSIMDTQITGWKRDGIHRFSKEGYGRQRSWVREGTEEGGNEPDEDGFTKLTKAEQLELPFDLPDREKG